MHVLQITCTQRMISFGNKNPLLQLTDRNPSVCVRATDRVQALELLQLRAELDAVVLFPLERLLQALSLFPLSTQLVLQTQPENREQTR